MKLQEIFELIEKDPACEVEYRTTPLNQQELNIPSDLDEVRNRYRTVSLFTDQPYGIVLLPTHELVTTNSLLYPENDVIWEELAGDLSEHWYVVASSEQLSQFISIDLSPERLGLCYDSYIDTHATPGDSMIIARNFTELLERLYNSKGQYWYWLESNLSYGDAYDDIQ